jgi:hypothetical protein
VRVCGGYLGIGWLLAVLWLAAASPAQSAAGEIDAGAALRTIPAYADAVVVVKNAAAHRRHPAGRGLMEVLESGGNLRETRRSWASLAAALGWTSDEAFDALLGERVTVLLRGLDAAQGPDWALLTEVSPESERRLRTRLAAVPRRSVGGLAVLSIEDGSCDIAVARPVRVEGSAGADRVAVLIGPGGGRLFDEIAPTLLSGRSADVLETQASFDVACVVRRPAEGESERFVMVMAGARESGWRARVLASPGAIWEAPAGESRWADGPLRRLEADSLLAVMSAESAVLAGTLGLLPGFAGEFPAVTRALRGVEGKRALISLQRTRGGATGRSAGRGPVLLARGEGSRAVEPGVAAPLSLSIAVESFDLHRGVVEGDRQIALLVAALQRGEAIGSTPLRMEVGVGDHEARLLPLGEMLESNPRVREMIESAFGPEPVLRWGITGGRALGAREQGWWYASLAPGRAADGGLSAALGASGEGVMRRRISAGVIRPAELLRSAGDAGAGFLGPLWDYRSVESLRWDAWVRDDGLVEGELDIGMRR